MTFEEYWWIGVCANPNMARDVLLKQIAESAWNAGAKAEREECAKVCEGQIDSFEANRGYGPEICAEAIRARSNVQVEGAAGGLPPEAPTRTPGSASYGD